MSGFLFYQFFLYLFERFVLGLGELYRKDKAAEGNKREKSEDIGAADRKEDGGRTTTTAPTTPSGSAAQHLPLGTPPNWGKTSEMTTQIVAPSDTAKKAM